VGRPTVTLPDQWFVAGKIQKIGGLELSVIQVMRSKLLGERSSSCGEINGIVSGPVFAA